MSVTLRDRGTWTREWIRRFSSYQNVVTWFGNLGVAQSIARATGDLAEIAEGLYLDIKRRNSLRGAPDDALDEVAAEYGTERAPATRSTMLLVVRTTWEQVMSISLGTGPVGAGDEIEVATGTAFTVGDSLRIRNGTGATTDVRTIVGITVGTGPGGGDEIEVAPLAGVYTPATDDVVILLRLTIPVDTTVTTLSGVNFQTKELLNAGNFNAVMNGESGSLALADKVWCESTTTGSSANVPAQDAIDFSPAIPGVVEVENIEAASGGADEETAYSLRYRAAHRGTLANQETMAWLEALAKEGNPDTQRAIPSTTATASTMAAKVLKRNGGNFSAAELTALQDYMEARVRSYMGVVLYNVTLTSVQVEAFVTLESGADFRTVWRAAADALASYLDWRKWTFGEDVPASDLFDLVSNAAGIATVEIPTFLPAANVTVAADSLPRLAYLALTNTATGETINANIATSF